MARVAVLFIICLLVVYCQAESQYVLGKQGQSCNQVCFGLQMNCNPVIETSNSLDLFTRLGVNCKADKAPWSRDDQPSYVSDPDDDDYGKCVGHVKVPPATHCSGSLATTQRICRCDPPTKGTPSTFGMSYADGYISTKEKWMFEYVLAPGDVGVLNHFWVTYKAKTENGVIIRYYIDGEKKASIEFTPSLACGVGFFDKFAPWGTEWFGKGAIDASWYNNFKIPFQKSIVVTTQHLYKDYDRFYMILRGAINVPITIGDLTLPTNAKMNLIATHKTFDTLAFVPLVDIPSGSGVLFMSTIAGESTSLDFLEGCFHGYFDGNNEFPGVLLSSGAEDYYDSAWYFSAGQFHLPVSGFTHLGSKNGIKTWSGYRFHDKDPLLFNNGFKFVWRIGDMNDAAGLKCQVLTGGEVAHSPAPTKVTAYAWVYTWPTQSGSSDENQHGLILKLSKESLILVCSIFLSLVFFA